MRVSSVNSQPFLAHDPGLFVVNDILHIVLQNIPEELRKRCRVDTQSVSRGSIEDAVLHDHWSLDELENVDYILNEGMLQVTLVFRDPFNRQQARYTFEV
ncbi:MAG: hypothetical protein ACD_62C00572G0004 [uncultured bacterium]|nr:MAG: hypothetical protein ACD_62C00572G0004 [uncultured bacterium]HLD45510.1 hypothetical protein [bacterium]